MALSNIDGVQIVLKGLEINELQQSEAAIISKFKDHYLTRVQEQLFSLIGGLSLIGNPGNTQKNISLEKK